MKHPILLLVLCHVLTAATASAATWVVFPDSTGDAPTIQAGIDSASAGDTVMVMSGTYHEHDVLIKSGIYLTSETGTAECVTIDADSLGRVCRCVGCDSTTSMVGFTVAGGLFAGYGGGMHLSASDIRITDCVFQYNCGQTRGGGVYVDGGSPIFTDCYFLWNMVAEPGSSVAGEGGGCFVYGGSAVFTCCTFSYNSVECTMAATGGGLACSGDCSPTLTDCLFESNNDGGVYVGNCDLAVFSDCVFRDNSADPSCVGAAMICYRADAVIMDCLFEGNSHGSGALVIRRCAPTITGCDFFDNIARGALAEYSSAPTFSYCVFAGNSDNNGAGIMVNHDSFVELVHCTVYGNTATGSGGGFFCADVCSASVDHCIIAFSQDGEAAGWDGTGAGPIFHCCDLYGNADGDWVGDIADQYAVNGNISDDPLFCDPENYDFSLCTGSPCHVAGGCGTIGAYGWITGFGITSVEDVGGDAGSFVNVAWGRNWYDSVAGDTTIDFYSIWRRDDALTLAGGGTEPRRTPVILTDPPGDWECIDSVAASGLETYAVTCSTLCDSTEGYLCWSVFFVRAHSPDPILEFDTLPDSGYSFNNFAHEAWTDVTTSVLDDAEAGAGLAWVDYDNDDDLDIFVTNRNYSNLLFRNDSLTAEGFVGATPPAIVDETNSRGCAWGDYDNDGDLDLYVCNKGANKFFRNDGGGDFVDITASPLDDAGTGQTASWVDYDNDGDVDIYVVNNGANKLFRNDGGGVFTDATTGFLGDGGFGIACGWADYDNDRDQDVYVANYTGANLLLKNEGGGAFSDATTPALEIPAASHGVAWGDYDNDGDLDLYVSNEGANNLLRNDAGVFTDVTAPPLDDANVGRGVAWGDYNLDGKLDLYLTIFDSPDNDANRLFKNLGYGTFVRKGSGSSPFEGYVRSLSAAWGDYDKDGDPDLYVVNDDNCLNRLVRNDLGPGHHWLEVRLVGLLSNSYGQGSRVRIVVGGLSQIREIAGASGYASQGPLTASFGLGTSSTVDTVEVRWPSGIVQAVADVACDQTIEIVEDELAKVSREPERHLAFRLYPCRPNPFGAVTSIRYDLPERTRVHATVYDVSGRLVRCLVDHDLKGPGRHTVSWDGRNSEDRPVGPGIYFYRLAAGPYTETRRMVLLK
jgi:hypothetical protein